MNPMLGMMLAGGGPAAGMAGGPAPLPQEQKKENPSRWANFMSNLKNDPNLQMAMLQTGLQMMQPGQPGQTPIGNIAGAVQGGVSTLDMLRQRDSQQQIEARDRALTEGRQEEDLRMRREGLGMQREQLRQQGRAQDRLASESAANMRMAEERLGLDRERLELERERLAQGVHRNMGAEESQIHQLAQDLARTNPELYSGDEGLARARLVVFERLRDARERGFSREQLMSRLLQDGFQTANMFNFQGQELSGEQIQAMVENAGRVVEFAFGGTETPSRRLTDIGGEEATPTDTAADVSAALGRQITAGGRTFTILGVQDNPPGEPPGRYVLAQDDQGEQGYIPYEQAMRLIR